MNVSDRIARDEVLTLLSKGELSADDFQRVLAFLPQVQAEWDQATRSDQERVVAELSRDLAPEIVAHLRESEGNAVAGMSSPDPFIRRVSLYILQKWHPTSRPTKDDLLRIIAKDDSLLVRDVAIRCLGETLRDTKDESTCAFLASLVLSEGEPDFIRRSAYLALIYIRGLWLSTAKPLHLLTFPEDVDWAFVRDRVSLSDTTSGE
jgi:hypothetical protein